MNLRTIDLNLLVVLAALIEERSVARAGQRIGLSRSATSHALARLRTLFDDDLLVRTASGMEPTPRAEKLGGPIRLALEEIQQTLAPDAFEPATAGRRFDLAVETYETIVILANLVDRISHEAPGLDVSVRSGPADRIIEDIDKGRADIAIGTFSTLPDRFMTRLLLSDRYVCVMRKDHPLASRPLGLDEFLATPHVLISMSGGIEDPIDEALAANGLRRRIAFHLPNGLAAVIALARSDMIAVVTLGAAQMFSASAPMVVREIPLVLPTASFRLVWNRRLHDSAPHIWLRRTLVEIGENAMASTMTLPVSS